jgi:hypothetical protein
MELLTTLTTASGGLASRPGGSDRASARTRSHTGGPAAPDGWSGEAGHEKVGYFGPSSDPADDVRLCLAMNYPGDAWRTSEGDCVYRPGPVDSTRFEIVDCDDETANGRVTARVEKFEAPGECDPWGSFYTTWRPVGFDDLGYTMCYEKI